MKRKRPIERAPTVGFVSLGCAKNLVDSEHMASLLASGNISLAPRPDEADVLIVNTCAFIGDAKTESIDAILEACAARDSGRHRAVIVAGCLSQRYGRDLRESMPEVDAYLGLDALDEIVPLVRRLVQGEGRGSYIVPPEARRVFEPVKDGVVLTGGSYAYIKIAEGCNHRCSFCIIPSIRGSYRSRRVDAIVRQAESLLGKGIRELILISQDTTSYGKDLGAGSDLPSLLRALGRLGGGFRVRLLYGHPAHVTDSLLDAIAEVPQVCKYLDLPIQHSHPDMLRIMRRPSGKAVITGLPERIRKVIPGVTLRTTCLVGHPGETRERFLHLRRFVESAQFDHLGVFAYSAEEGTPAATMAGRVPRRTAEERRGELMLLQRGIVRKNGRKLVGRKDTFLVEGPAVRRTAGSLRARSGRSAPEIDGETLISGVPSGIRAGVFITARYVGTRGYDMLAEYCSCEDI
ncbi:MAG: 30S ribosomal protein S12 methylthiotransferase RimO [bacterium]